MDLQQKLKRRKKELKVTLVELLQLLKHKGFAASYHQFVNWWYKGTELAEADLKVIQEFVGNEQPQAPTFPVPGVFLLAPQQQKKGIGILDYKLLGVGISQQGVVFRLLRISSETSNTGILLQGNAACPQSYPADYNAVSIDEFLSALQEMGWVIREPKERKKNAVVR